MLIQTNSSRHLSDKEPAIEKKQQLRIQRLTMAMYTYAVVTVASVLVTWLGLGVMNTVQWTIFIALALLNNALFYILFRTNTNLRFPDHSLTREQITLSALWGMVPLYSLPEARPIILMFFLPAFSFGMLRLNRRQYLSVVVIVMGLYSAILMLAYFKNPDGFKLQYELFLFVIYGILLTWFALFGGFISHLRQRLRDQNNKINKAHEAIKIEIKERQQAQHEKDALIIELQDAMRRVKKLGGMLPICASCKKIRDDQGYWKQIETYIKDHSDVDFSHSICPECCKKLYPNMPYKK
jgi:cell division protein FtsL